MKLIGTVRNIDPLGRVVIPKEIRNIFNLKVDDPIEIFANDQNEIIIKKYEPACIFCSGTEGVVLYNGKQICKHCVAKLTDILSDED